MPSSRAAQAMYPHLSDKGEGSTGRPTERSTVPQWGKHPLHDLVQEVLSAKPRGAGVPNEAYLARMGIRRRK
jgi:hypothetical protein